MNTTPTSGAADLRATFSEMLVDLPNTEPYTLFQAGFDAALAAGQATAAQQGVAYAALPESFLEIPDVQDESGINAYYSREVVLECIDAALASHGQAPAGATASGLPEPLSKRPSEANTLVWVADPISSTGVRGVFVDDITCLWWWGAGLIFQKEADAAALALRMRSQVYNVFL